ncbi:MAG: NAD-dependent succinate-semialdehyde dehydrogenase [Bacteroidales bacterium]|nr:NAD-dependent succinate-semialdehyde dehydrogenase [Bacteroidales bacterium]
MKSINPTNGEIIREYQEHTYTDVRLIIENAYQAWSDWKERSFESRSALIKKTAQALRDGKEQYARLMTLEMGKLLRESMAEIEKCAIVCDFYADHAAEILQDEEIKSDASRSFITYQPLGVILAVMPWNFPFWQVFRFAAPALMAGNSVLLKHASNVPGCALAIENIFTVAGFPNGIFKTLMIPSAGVDQVIAHPRVRAVSLTGSESAGSHVASLAGKYIKKSLLELGGSDPFIILEDADMEATIKSAVNARMINQGQSCIASKRFIVVKSRVQEFESGLETAFDKLIIGNPLEEKTQVGPLARADLVDEIERQVLSSVESGARLVSGGKRPSRAGCYYKPTILSDVKYGMAVYHEETFGPVAVIIPVDNEAEAIRVANDSEFGLGGCVWTTDLRRGEAVARKIISGAMFVNGMTKSDPRLPFGGVGKSGYGRELGSNGIKEFMNIKTIWIG